MLIIVKKKKVIQLIVNEGWYSSREMKDDLKWSQMLVLRRLRCHSAQEED